MAFYIPPIKDMVQRARNAFRAEMPGTDAWVWPNNIYVSAKVIGGSVWEVFGRLKWMDRQRFALTATGYELERHGLDYGISRLPSSYALGNVVFVANTWPLTIPVGTKVYRNDGTSYTTTTAQDINQYTLSATVPIVADVAGKNGNTIYGTPMTTTLANISSVAVDNIGIGQGADQETYGKLRTRILHRKRYPPNGGSEQDYIGWGLSLPGVTRVFVKGNGYGRGTVAVWFLMDDTYPAGIPQQNDVNAMQAYLESVAPVNANVIVTAPIADCVDITVTGLVPDTQATRESAAAELASYFRNNVQPSTPGSPFTLYRSGLWQAVGNAAGEESFSITAPLTDIGFAVGAMPCINSVTFLPAPTS
jgi:uncharacterized phage protein gp47/JayE